MYVENENNLLFLKAGGSTVCGYKILENMQKQTVPKITGLLHTRLRKHLATTTQLFTLN